MYQNITLAGRLGGDPELRFTPAGVQVCTFSVATDRVWNNDQGEKQEETTWHRVTTWRKQAETCALYLKKGSMVLVAGTVKAHGYINRADEVGASLEVNADVVRFLSSKGDAGQVQVQAQASTVESELEDAMKNGIEIPF